MRIEYDAAKRAANLAKHRVDMADAAIVFEGEAYSFADRRRDYGEIRMITIGRLAGRMVMVVWTARGETRRIISMRKCNDREEALYRPWLG